MENLHNWLGEICERLDALQPPLRESDVLSVWKAVGHTLHRQLSVPIPGHDRGCRVMIRDFGSFFRTTSGDTKHEPAKSFLETYNLKSFVQLRSSTQTRTTDFGVCECAAQTNRSPDQISKVCQTVLAVFGERASLGHSSGCSLVFPLVGEIVAKKKLLTFNLDLGGVDAGGTEPSQTQNPEAALPIATELPSNNSIGVVSHAVSLQQRPPSSGGCMERGSQLRFQAAKERKFHVEQELEELESTLISRLARRPASSCSTTVSRQPSPLCDTCSTASGWRRGPSPFALNSVMEQACSRYRQQLARERQSDDRMRSEMSNQLEIAKCMTKLEQDSKRKKPPFAQQLRGLCQRETEKTNAPLASSFFDRFVHTAMPKAERQRLLKEALDSQLREKSEEATRSAQKQYAQDVQSIISAADEQFVSTIKTTRKALNEKQLLLSAWSVQRSLRE